MRASGVDYRMDSSDEKLVAAFMGFFPHMRAPAGVLRPSAYDGHLEVEVLNGPLDTSKSKF